SPDSTLQCGCTESLSIYSRDASIVSDMMRLLIVLSSLYCINAIEH
ncbi:hypothetical protein V3C99_003605, partial [Haemonchus contortus]